MGFFRKFTIPFGRAWWKLKLKFTGRRKPKRARAPGLIAQEINALEKVMENETNRKKLREFENKLRLLRKELKLAKNIY